MPKIYQGFKTRKSTMEQSEGRSSNSEYYHCYSCEKTEAKSDSLEKEPEIESEKDIEKEAVKEIENGFEKTIKRRAKKRMERETVIGTENRCKFCGSEAIERVEKIESFQPQKVFELPLTSEKKESKVSNSRRTFERSIRLSVTDPYTRNTLVPLFPQVFRRASIRRIEELRQLFQGLYGPPRPESAPAEKSYVENIPRIPFGHLTSPAMKGCPVCTEDFELEELTMSLACTHTFHQECLTPWLQIRGCCPMCRAQLPLQS